MIELQETEKAEGLVTPPPTDNQPFQRKKEGPKMIFQTKLLSKKHFETEKRIIAAIRRALRRGRAAIFFAVALALITASRTKPAHCAEPALKIDLYAISMIESSGNPKAIGPDGSIGLFQITPIVLKEFNAAFPSKKTDSTALFDAQTSRGIADWYLHKRIPQMLRHFKKPVTTRNIIIAWNAGIRYVKTGSKLPKITVRYLKNYKKFLASNVVKTLKK